jgi:hypothetical protein
MSLARRFVVAIWVILATSVSMPAWGQDTDEPPVEPPDDPALAPPPAKPVVSPQVVRLRNSGAVLTGVGLGLALGGSAMAALGQQTAADAQAAAEYLDADGRAYLDPAKWVVYEDDYEAGRDLNRGGWVMLAAGGAVAVTGLVLLARGAHLHRQENPLTACAVVTPEGGYLQVTGRF